MRKQVILKMQGNQYPFGQLNQPPNPKSKIDSRILVRKIHETRTLQQRNQLLDSIHAIKNIKSLYLMKIESVLQQDNSIHVLYQYVPNSLLKNIGNMPTHILNNIKEQLLELGKIIAEIGYKVQWDIKNVGINEKMIAKYYLDLDRISADLVSGKAKLQRLHNQNITQIINQLTKVVSNNQKTVALNKNKKIQIPIQATKLQNARAANSIQSNTDAKRYKFPQTQQTQKLKIPQQQKIVPKPKSIPKPKISQKLQQKQLVPPLPLKKSRTDWKQLDQNQQFMKDFINVLDDKSQNAQSKYLSDQQERSGQRQQEQQQVQQQFIEMQLPNNQKNDNQQQQQDGQQDQQIVWVSTPQQVNNDHGEQQHNNQGEEQEVVWVDYNDIKNRAQEAIRRSTNALAAFRSILSKCK